MIRTLIAAAILLAVAAILVSPCADLDDAVHHHQHHHHFELSVNGEESVMHSLEGEYGPLNDSVVTATIIDSASPAMRC